MNHGYGGNHANSYLAQRINSASPEELAGMLLGGAERFLTQAAAAVRSGTTWRRPACCPGLRRSCRGSW